MFYIYESKVTFLVLNDSLFVYNIRIFCISSLYYLNRSWALVSPDLLQPGRLSGLRVTHVLLNNDFALICWLVHGDTFIISRWRFDQSATVKIKQSSWFVSIKLGTIYWQEVRLNCQLNYFTFDVQACRSSC